MHLPAAARLQVRQRIVHRRPRPPVPPARAVRQNHATVIGAEKTVVPHDAVRVQHAQHAYSLRIARLAQAVRPNLRPCGCERLVCLGTGGLPPKPAVDPLGLFRASRLVENDERDHKALEAARRLVEAASSLVGGAPADATAGPDGEGAANAEAAALARALVRKAWERREHIPAISRLFLVEALDQTAARLGRGR